MAQSRYSILQRPVLSLSPWHLIVALAVCMALQFTSVVIIMPLYARRFNDFGAGVSDLGLSTLAYALAGVLAAPIMGSLADRIGRRPIILGSLLVYVLTFAGYLLSESVAGFILLRGLSGAFTAGLIPAVMGIVADTAPQNRRAQYIGIVNGGASAGWIAGPLIGGFLYDQWGYVVPFALSIGMAVFTLLFALVTVPETHPATVPLRLTGVGLTITRWLAARRSIRLPKLASQTNRDWLPMLVLLSITLTTMFAWSFIEPELMFYAYNELDWTSSQLGGAISFFGLAMMLGEFGLGRSSDHLGRKPVLILGLVLFSAQFAGLVFSQSYAWIIASFIIAGLGNALFDPALTASIMDLAPQAHKARSMGLKSTASSLGSVIGPALVVILTPYLLPQGVFLISLILVILVTILAALTLPSQKSSFTPVMAEHDQRPVAVGEPE